MRFLRRLLPILLLLTPSLVSAQTTNSRTQDGLGNRIDSTTSTPVGNERGFVMRVIPGAAQPVTMTTAPLPPGAATLEATQNIEAAIREAQGIGGTSPFLVTQSGTWTVQPGNTPNTTPWIVSQVPATSGGGSTCYLTSAASTNATNCKASAGQVYHISAINTTGTIYYLRMYNLAAAPTCSSATGFIGTLPILESTAGPGLQRGMVSGQAYSAGIGFCLTGGGSSTDNTNAATGVYLSVILK